MSRLLGLNPRWPSQPASLMHLHCVPTLHSWSHRVEDLEGRADIGTDSGDVLLLSTHVAVLGSTGLQGEENTHEEIRLKDPAS